MHEGEDHVIVDEVLAAVQANFVRISGVGVDGVGAFPIAEILAMIMALLGGICPVPKPRQVAMIKRGGMYVEMTIIRAVAQVNGWPYVFTKEGRQIKAAFLEAGKEASLEKITEFLAAV